MKKTILAATAAATIMTGCGGGGDKGDNLNLDNNTTHCTNPDKQDLEKKNFEEKVLGIFTNFNLVNKDSEILKENIDKLYEYKKSRNLEIDFDKFEENFGKLDEKYKDFFKQFINSNIKDIENLYTSISSLSKFDEESFKISTNFKDDLNNIILIPFESVIYLQNSFEQNEITLEDFNKIFNKLEKKEKIGFYNLLKTKNKEKIEEKVNEILFNIDDIIGGDNFDLLKNTVLGNIIENNEGKIDFNLEQDPDTYEITISTEHFSRKLSFVNVENLTEEEIIEVLNIINIFKELEEFKKVNNNTNVDLDKNTISYKNINIELQFLKNFNKNTNKFIDISIIKGALNSSCGFFQVLDGLEIKKDLNLNYDFNLEYKHNNKYIIANNGVVEIKSLDYKILYKKLIYNDYKLKAERIKNDEIKIYNEKGEINLFKKSPDNSTTKKMVKGEFSKQELEDIYNKNYFIKNPNLYDIQVYNNLQVYVNDGSNYENPFIPKKDSEFEGGDTWETKYSMLINFDNDCDGWAIDGIRLIKSFENIKGVSRVDIELTDMPRHITLFFAIHLDNGKVVYGTYGTFGLEIITEDKNGEIKKISSFSKTDKITDFGIDASLQNEARKILWKKYSFFAKVQDSGPIAFHSSKGFISFPLGIKNSNELREFNGYTPEEIQKIKIDAFKVLLTTEIPMEVNDNTQIKRNLRLVNDIVYISEYKQPLYDWFHLTSFVKDEDGNKLTESDINFFVNEDNNIIFDINTIDSSIIKKIQNNSGLDLNELTEIGLKLTDLNKIFYESSLDDFEKNEILNSIKKAGFKRFKNFYEENNIKDDVNTFYLIVDNLKGEELDNFLLSIDNFDFLAKNYSYVNFNLHLKFSKLNSNVIEHIVKNTTNGLLLLDFAYRIEHYNLDIDYLTINFKSIEDYILSGEKFIPYRFLKVYLKFKKYFSKDHFIDYITNNNLQNYLSNGGMLNYINFAPDLNKNEKSNILNKLYSLLLNTTSINLLDYENFTIKYFLNDYKKYSDSKDTKNDILNLLNDSLRDIEDLDSIISLYSEIADVNIKEKINNIKNNNDYTIDSVIQELLNNKIESGELEKFFQESTQEEIEQISIFSEKENYIKGSSSYLLIRKILNSFDLEKYLNEKVYQDVKNYYGLEDKK